MTEFDKIKRFRRSFEKGQKGKVSSFNIWLSDKGLDPEKANISSISSYFRENPEEATNHHEPFEKIAEFVGFFFERGGIYHISITGISKIGRTQFLHTLDYALQKLGEDINSRYYDATDFAEMGDEEQYFFDVLEEISSLEKIIVMLDNCEKDRRIEYSLKEIVNNVKDSLIVTSWTPEAWNRSRDRINEIIPPSKELSLTPFDSNETVQMLRKVLEFMSENGIEFQEKFLQKIHEKSAGIPELSIRLFLETLKETFLKDLELGDSKAIGIAAESLNLINLEECLKDLSEQHLVILKNIVLSYDERGMTPSELVEILNRDKATVSYHLQKLSSKKILVSEKYGRNTFYKVKEGLKPLVQLRLEKESEFYG